MKSFFARLRPKSLTAQLLLLVLSAILVAQAVAVGLSWGERREAVRAALHEQILSRTASLVALLVETPAGDRARVAKAASTRALRFKLEAAPRVTEAKPWPSRYLDRNLSQILGGQLQGQLRQVRMDWVHHDRGERDHDKAAAEGTGDRWIDDLWPNKARRRFGWTVLLSLELADGNWLNAVGRLPAPPPLNWQVGLAGILAALLVSLVVILALRRITRPLKNLAAASDAFGRGTAVSPLNEEGPAEIRQASRAFNEMQERIARSIDERTRMFAAISHDLRTPITALRIRAEFIEDEELREKILASVEEMQRMTEETLAYLKEGASSEPARDVDVGALLESLIEDLAELGHAARFDPESGLPRAVVSCRPLSLKRALRNLLGNALRYGESLTARMDVSPQSLEILIEDEGPGIPEDHLEQVFDPFHRLEGSRSRETGGAGLGLAIARSILRDLGGDVRLENRSEGGLRARVTLPLVPESIGANSP